MPGLGGQGLGGGLFPVPADWGPCPCTVDRRAGPLGLRWGPVLGLVWPLQLLPPLESLKYKHRGTMQLLEEGQTDLESVTVIHDLQNKTNCRLSLLSVYLLVKAK